MPVRLYSYILIFLSFVAQNHSAISQSSDDYLAIAQEFHKKSIVDSAVYNYKKAVLFNFDKSQKIAGCNLAVDIADLFYSTRDFKRGLKVLSIITDQPLTFESEEERAAMLEAYLFIAYGLEQLGKFIEAKNIYEKAKLELVSRIEYEDFYVGRYLYQPLGNIYTRLGELEEALKLLERFKEISVAEGEFIAAAEAYNDIGIIYKSLNHHEKVISDYHTALDFPGLNAQTRGLLLSNLATAYYENLQNDHALQTAKLSISHFQKALQENENPNEILSYLSLVYSTLGKIQTSSNQTEQAVGNFTRSVELARTAYGTKNRREVAKIYTHIAYAYLLDNQPRIALKNYQQALSCVIPDLDTGGIYQNPEYDQLHPENTIFEALEGKARALELLYEEEREINILKLILECFDLISQVERQLRQNYLHESSKLLLIDESHDRSERALNTAYRLYQETNDPQYLEKAFQISENSKATILLESLKTLKANDFGYIPDSLLLKEKELSSKITYLKKNLLDEQLKADQMDTSIARTLSNELFYAERSLRELNTIYRDKYPQYFQLRNESRKKIDVNAIGDELLTPNSQLVAFFTGDNDLFIFSLTDEEFQLIKVKNDGSLNKNVQSLLQLVTSSDNIISGSDEFATYAYSLYKTLLAPVVQKDKPNLILVPDGILGYLPFDLLIDQKSEDSNFSTLSYLVKSRSISYGYSAGILMENNSPPSNGKSKKPFLGVAPVFENNIPFPFLPFSEREVKAISEGFGGTVLIGKNATKAGFMAMASQYEILHLSSHASVADTLPMYSWIGFSGGSSESENDYKLYLSELYSMKLNAKLAVLSACETGGGKLSRGEGIMSLARGFTYAGCNSIVTTLWPVNDASTSFIMTRFYHHLANGMSKNDALRSAKVDYLQGENIDQFGAHPFFWAAYIPIGNMDSISIPDGQFYLLYGAIVFFFILVLGLGYRKWRKTSIKLF